MTFLFNVGTNWVMVSVAYRGSSYILRPLAGHDLLLHRDCFLNDVGGERGERRSKHFCYHLLVRSSQPQPSITLLIIEASFIAWIAFAVGKREGMKDRLLCNIDKTHIVIYYFYFFIFFPPLEYSYGERETDDVMNVWSASLRESTAWDKPWCVRAVFVVCSWTCVGGNRWSPWFELCSAVPLCRLESHQTRKN